MIYLSPNQGKRNGRRGEAKIMTTTATRPTTTATEIVIKQYRITGRCVLRSGGHDIAGLHDAVAHISVKSDGDRAKQESALAETLGGFGYEMSTIDRDDYGNWLLTFAKGPQMSANNALYWG